MPVDTHSEVTTPLDLPRLGGRDRRRALVAGTAAVAAAALLDTLLAGPGERSFVWVAWTLFFATAAILSGRSSPGVDLVVGVAAGFVAVAGLVSLAALTGGTRSPYFVFLAVVPLLSALAAPGEIAGTALVGLATLSGGIVVHLRERAPATQLLVWSALTALAATYALFAGDAQRRRQAAFLQVERERADALARLAEAERARTSIERWAVIGQVADQVAHDVNSPLGALRSSLAYAREEILGGRSDGALEALQDATACVERIRLIVTDLGTRGLPRAGVRGAPGDPGDRRGG